MGTDREPTRKRNHISKEKPPLEKHTSTETPSFDKDPLREKLIAESMLLLFMLATQASASPVVVPGGSLVLPNQGNLLRSIMLPYYPAYPFTNWRLVPQLPLLSSRSTWTIPVRKREFSGTP